MGRVGGSFVVRVPSERVPDLMVWTWCSFEQLRRGIRGGLILVLLKMKVKAGEEFVVNL